MRGAIITALVATLAIFAFAGAKPASALPAAAALDYSQPSGDLVQVKKWYRNRYRGPYYRPYRYNRPYYRPYYRLTTGPITGRTTGPITGLTTGGVPASASGSAGRMI